MTEQIMLLAAYCICVAFAFGVGLVVVNAVVMLVELLVIVGELIKSYVRR